MDLSDLLGKTVWDVIKAFPSINWSYMENGKETYSTKLNSIVFVYYDWIKPRQDIDLYEIANFNDSFHEKMDELMLKSNMGLGLISKANFSVDYIDSFQGHIPMIDFDVGGSFDFMEKTELISLIKNNIIKSTEIKKGVIMQSGPSGNYHFIGLKNLLSDNDFITFIGLSLGMRYTTKEGTVLNLVDARHMGHALSPLKYLKDIDSEVFFSKYEVSSRFATLRVVPKPAKRQNRAYEDYPRVVEVIDE